MRLVCIVTLVSALPLILGCASPLERATPSPTAEATVRPPSATPSPIAATATATAVPPPTRPPSPTAAHTPSPSPSSNEQANGGSSAPSISADGRFVAFFSEASNLVPGDTNRTTDVFVRDRLTGQTERVSVSSDGTQGDYSSDYPSISGDGRYVAFSSYATNLVPDDRAGHRDIFVRDRLAGTTRCVSVDAEGVHGNGDSYAPAISSDGRYVAFVSWANNLVPDDASSPDVFVCDLDAGTLQKVSVDMDLAHKLPGSRACAISADGRWVTFSVTPSGEEAQGRPPFVIEVYVRDLATRTTARVTVGVDGEPANGPSSSVSISGDGRWVAFVSNATNLTSEAPAGQPTAGLFLYDRVNARLRRLANAGGPFSPAYMPEQLVDLSADGRWLAFARGGISMYDLETGAVDAVVAGGAGDQPSISADGRYVAFASSATNLVVAREPLVPGEQDTNGVPDIFVRDHTTGTAERVSVASR